MFHRSYGQTKNCKGCRFWSEMIAKAVGGGPVKAMCLADGGPLQGKYTSATASCDGWKSGHLGAVDDPPDYGRETQAAYIKEEGESALLAATKGCPRRGAENKERQMAFWNEPLFWIWVLLLLGLAVAWAASE